MSRRLKPVIPNVLDSSMRGSKDEDSDIENEIMNPQKPKKEEVGTGFSTNVWLILIFGAIIIILVLVIVWLVVRHNNKSEEYEVQQMIRPSAYNPMPPHEYVAQYRPRVMRSPKPQQPAPKPSAPEVKSEEPSLNDEVKKVLEQTKDVNDEKDTKEGESTNEVMEADDQELLRRMTEMAEEESDEEEDETA